MQPAEGYLDSTIRFKHCFAENGTVCISSETLSSRQPKNGPRGRLKNMGMLFPIFEHRNASLISAGRGMGVGDPDLNDLTKKSLGSKILQRLRGWVDGPCPS